MPVFNLLLVVFTIQEKLTIVNPTSSTDAYSFPIPNLPTTFYSPCTVSTKIFVRPNQFVFLLKQKIACYIFLSSFFKFLILNNDYLVETEEYIFLFSNVFNMKYYAC